MTKVIINADDFGLCKGVNYGILEAHINGLLTSTTLMVTMPGAEHAAQMMKSLPTLGVGLHLNVSLGKPLTNNKTLVDEYGSFMKPQSLEKDIYDVEEVYFEFKAQYEKFIELTSQKPTHLDTHLFSSDKIPSVQEAIIRLGNETNTPVRNLSTNLYDRVEFITFRKYGDPVGLDYLFDRIDDFEKYDVIEIMSHPGYLDDFIMTNSSYNTQRLKELEILTSKELSKIFDKKKFEFITYNDLQKG